MQFIRSVWGIMCIHKLDNARIVSLKLNITSSSELRVYWHRDSRSWTRNPRYSTTNTCNKNLPENRPNPRNRSSYLRISLTWNSNLIKKKFDYRKKWCWISWQLFLKLAPQTCRQLELSWIQLFESHQWNIKIFASLELAVLSSLWSDHIIAKSYS